MQASLRVDVDEAPYAPGTDLLYVTELEDAHDSIELLKSDDNLEFFYAETVPTPDSDETSGQSERPVCVTCLLLSRFPVSSHVSLRPTFFETRIKVARSAMQRESLEMDESQTLRGLLSVRKISSVFSSFPDLPNASSVGSLNHATLPICVRRSVVGITNMSTFHAFPSLCVSLCLLERLYTAIHRPPAQTHLHVSQAP